MMHLNQSMYFNVKPIKIHGIQIIFILYKKDFVQVFNNEEFQMTERFINVKIC